MYPRSERAPFDESGGVGQMVYGLKAWHAVYGVYAETLAVAPDVADRLRARNRGALWTAIYRAPVEVDPTLPAGTWEVRGKVPAASDDLVAATGYAFRRLLGDREQADARYLEAFGKPPRRPTG